VRDRERVQAQDEVRERLDRARAAAGLGSVRRAARHGDSEATEALARRLQVARRGRRLAHERGRGAVGRAGEELARGGAADLLVGGDDHAQRMRGVRTTDRLEQHDEPAFHVVRAGPVRPSVLDAPRHRLERPPRPHRVEVAEEHERRPATAELRVEVVGHPLHLRSQGRQLRSEPLAQRTRVARRRLELHELAQERHEVGRLHAESVSHAPPLNARRRRL